jgi:hypothetical protein
LRLRRLEKIGPEELGHTTHGVKLCQATEYVSLIRIDFNLIRNFMLLQNALQFMRMINRYRCVLGSMED